MTKDGAQPEKAHEASPSPAPTTSPHPDHSEYTPQLTKADLEDSLSAMYDRLARKFQAELQKSTSTLTQEIAALGGRTDMLETKHDELHLVYVDLHKDHEALTDTVTQLQSHLKDLDNRTEGITEGITSE